MTEALRRWRKGEISKGGPFEPQQGHRRPAQVVPWPASAASRFLVGRFSWRTDQWFEGVLAMGVESVGRSRGRRLLTGREQGICAGVVEQWWVGESSEKVT